MRSIVLKNTKKTEIMVDEHLRIKFKFRSSFSNGMYSSIVSDVYEYSECWYKGYIYIYINITL